MEQAVGGAVGGVIGLLLVAAVGRVGAIIGAMVLLGLYLLKRA